ncbi:MAG TPA: arsinothricin resistance N-acetyltransferase ArsN1 family A [Thermomicrobiales bacterium]|jgi:phosphinothricin acetyltransferase|nr:arsinothricin resistance N-acetyltransferase ArsN1 family A [Thermomicrobiales bacterium]
MPPSGLTTRAATPDDAAAIAAIYNQGIEERIATFETRLRTPEDILPWFDVPYPVVVVEEITAEADQARDGRRVVGFAAASAYRPRECYAGIAEYSVYVDGGARGRGVGRLALEALFAAAESAGYWKLVSRIFVENTASRALMRRMGFREVGVYERHARLDDAWRDVVIVEKLLGPAFAE